MQLAGSTTYIPARINVDMVLMLLMSEPWKFYFFIPANISLNPGLNVSIYECRIFGRTQPREKIKPSSYFRPCRFSIYIQDFQRASWVVVPVERECHWDETFYSRKTSILFPVLTMKRTGKHCKWLAMSFLKTIAAAPALLFLIVGDHNFCPFKIGIFIRLE